MAASHTNATLGLYFNRLKNALNEASTPVVWLGDAPDIDNPASFVMTAHNVIVEKGGEMYSRIHPRPLDLELPHLAGEDQQRMEMLLKKYNGVESSKYMIPIQTILPLERQPTSEGSFWATLKNDPDNKDLYDKYAYDSKDNGPEYQARIQKDSDLYLKVCVVRFIQLFLAGVPDGRKLSRPRFYKSSPSLKGIQHGINPVRHADDWTYGFSQALRAKYHELNKEYPSGPERRRKFVELMEKYIKDTFETFKSMWPELKDQTADDLMEDFGELAQRFKEDGVKVGVVVAGGFDGVDILLQKDVELAWMICMALYIQGDSNLNPQQMNIAYHPESAKTAFDHIKTKKVPTLILPTEVVKNITFGYNWSTAELEKAFHKQPIWPQLFEQYGIDAGLRSVTPYDLCMTALMFPEAWEYFLYCTVDVEEQMVEMIDTDNCKKAFLGEVKGVYKPVRTDEGSIMMCWTDEAHQKKNKSDLLDFMVGKMPATVKNLRWKDGIYEEK